MAITPLPDVPQRSDTPDVFVAKADAFMAALPQFQEEANAAAEAMNLNATSGTSASSVAIGTGAKSFTASTGKSWLPGMFIVIADTAAPSTNSMIAQVTSYNSGTGALVVDVKGVLGSGTKTAWTISQTANPIPLNDSVTFARMQDIVTKRLLGRNGASTGDPEEVTLAQLLAWGDFLVTAGTLGYGTGSGGAVTQTTSKSTAVTLNEPSGQITMNNAALASATTVTFSLNNSLVTTADTVILTLSGGVADGSAYDLWPYISTAGTVRVNVRNRTAGSLSEAVVINFAIIKGSTS